MTAPSQPGSSTTTGADDRDLILGYLARQLIGPAGGASELLTEPPHKRYLTGVLYPQEVRFEQDGDDDIDDDLPGDASQEKTRQGEGEGEDPVALAGQQLPSSLGLSFVLPGWQAFDVEVAAARYEAEGRAWRRVPSAADQVRLTPPDRPGRADPLPVLDGAAQISCLWRRQGAGALVTVALVNTAVTPADGRVDPGDCLLQVSLRCSTGGGFPPYPSVTTLLAGEEEEELALLYRDVPTFAVGHGCSAVWETGAQDMAATVATSHMPSSTVPAVTFTLAGNTGDDGPAAPDVLSLAFLSRIHDEPGTVTAALRTFVDGYAGWAATQVEAAGPLKGWQSRAAGRVTGRIGEAVRRMRGGVALLGAAQSADVRRAFSLANTAMALQMRHRDALLGGQRRPLGEADLAVQAGPEVPVWRPFQLAFLLLTLESVVDPGSPERDLIDLIWFPTGGGKTEAYLGLLAFTVMHRRLTSADAGAGTTVITRYTLRLLTAQQFARAATLVCALELLRRADATTLGTREIGIGLWVGGGSSPNSYVDAVKLLADLQAGEWRASSFQIDSCPWCGTDIVPQPGHETDPWGIGVTNATFRVHCPEPSCDFHDGLPLTSVDEDIYVRCPTVVIGTVDKFARMTWDDRAGALLGSGGDPGPSLIIQDEFHLIAGPLGTVMGLYEAAFDVVLQQRGRRPKVVASTATIRRAVEQGRGVFGRETSLFPPAGLAAADSYFVRYDRRRPGRLYAGIMPQGHTPLTGMVHLAAGLLQAPLEVPLSKGGRDAYWTLVAYHNSLRELGKTVTLAHDDIPKRLEVIATAEDDARGLHDDDIIELTGNVPARDIPANLDRLNRGRDDPAGVSFVAASSMLSVGVDVPRLGLMLVVGQPKTTAEYIQASSRVGRTHPGLVFTLYSPSKPRDRSHYESFSAYHSSLYRHVEPSSVTPFSAPARNRALHAALVVLARHAAGLHADSAAADFDAADPTMVDLIRRFLDRAGIADPTERDHVERHLHDLGEQWAGAITKGEDSGGLRYAGGGRERRALLRRFGERRDGWETLDSMRNVDAEVRMRIRGADR